MQTSSEIIENECCGNLLMTCNKKQLITDLIELESKAKAFDKFVESGGGDVTTLQAIYTAEKMKYVK